MKKLLPVLVLTACTHMRGTYAVSGESVQPGQTVQAGGKPVELYNEGTVLKVGQPIASYWNALGVDQTLAGKVAVIGVVPSVDTPVCEEQTHILGETKMLSPDVLRVSVSRDLPMAQKRFAQEAKLTSILYVSDYKSGDFGKKSGLMMKGSELLARAVIVVDKQGVVQHLQVVPNVATLPDMEKAFSVANSLNEKAR